MEYIMSKRCFACGKSFRSHPQVPDQNYCSASACQRERRRLWQQQKRRTDPDYVENQARAHKSWAKSHSEYWAKYRSSHPEYAEQNRLAQLKRNQAKQALPIEKMDESGQPPSLPPGRYLLTPVSVPGIAKMDAWIVEITFLSMS
jgi:hypothetical protein